VKDSPSTISDVARALGVTIERASEILSVVDAARTGGTVTPSVVGAGGSDGAAPTMAMPLDEPGFPGRSVPDLSSRPDDQGLGGGDTWTGTGRTPAIAARYEQLDELGRGGVGQVFLVRDRHFDRMLALKVMREDAAAAGLAPSLFLREARVEARLQHPGVPPVYDRGELPDGRPWYTMKRVEGVDLTTIIRRLHAPGGGDLRAVIRHFEQVCRTVAYAHEQGVVHRDLKPENIMVGDLGEVLVLDWGLAVMLDEVGASSGAVSVVGTPAYMSPEQARGDADSLSPSTDVYALGAILYQILSGRPPYLGRNAREVVVAVRTGPPDPLVADAVGVAGPRPRALVDLCAAAMARVPHGRPDTARVVADVIRAWLDHAERQGRGLAEIGRARSIAATIGSMEARRQRVWAEAERLLQRTDPELGVVWVRWRESWSLQQQVAAERERERSALRAALAHSPGLVDAHLPLARHHGEAAARYAVVADAAGQQREDAIGLRHREALPVEARQQLEGELSGLLADPLWRESARRAPLVGRDSLLAALERRVEGGARLTVLHGGPGVGKSALLVALGVGLGRGTRRVVFQRVALAEDVATLAQQVGMVLAPGVQGGLSPEALLARLGAEPLVLLLDGLDRCTSDAGRTLDAWLEAAPGLQVVLTSRRVPDGLEDAAVTVPPLGRLGAFELFIESAVRAAPSLDIGMLDLDMVLGLVDGLEGVPLAVELAAARVGAVPLDELRQRLDSTLDLLGGGVGTGGGLDVAMSLSWDCLGPEARDVLLQLSVFESVFDRGAVEGVVELSGGAGATLDALDELADQGLLRQERSVGGTLNLSLTRAVRLWAAARLGGAGEGSEQVVGLRRRHAAYLAEHYGGTTSGGGQIGELARVLDDLVSAVQEGPPEFITACMRPIVRLLTSRGPLERGVSLGHAVLERGDLDPMTRRAVMVSLADCLRALGRHGEASAVLRDAEALRLAADAGPEAPEAPREQLDHLVAQARIAFDNGLLEDAGRGYQEALRLARVLDDVDAMVRCYMGLGLLAEPDTALPHFSRARRLARKRGTPALEWDVVGNQALALARAGRADEALAAFAEAEAGQTAVGNHNSAAIFALNLGQMHIRGGELDAAEEALRRSLASGRKAESPRVVAAAQGVLASLMIRKGEYTEAGSLAALAYASQRERGDRSQASRTCRLLTAISIDSGDPVGAKRHLRTLLQAETIESSESRLARVHEAEVLVMTGERTEAARRLEDLLEEAQAADDGAAGALVSIALGEVYELLEEPERSLEAFESALRCMGPRRAGSGPLHGVALAGVAVGLARRGAFEEAQSQIDEARRIVDGWAIESVRCQLRSGFIALEVGDAVGVVQALQDSRRRLTAMSVGIQGLPWLLFHRLHDEFSRRPSGQSEPVRGDHPGPSSSAAEQVRQLAELALSALQRGAMEAADGHLVEAESLDPTVDDAAARAWVRYLRMVWLRTMCVFDEAEQIGREALELAREARDLSRQMHILTQLATTLRQRGDPVASHECLVEAQELATELGAQRSEAIILAGFAHLALEEERFDVAVRGFRAAGAQLRELGLPEVAALTDVNTAEALLRLGRLREAGELLAVHGGADSVGQGGTAAMVRSLRAWLHAADGGHDVALRVTDSVVEDASLPPLDAAKGRLRAAEVAQACGEPQRARDHVLAAEGLIGTMPLLESSHVVRWHRRLHAELESPGSGA